VYNQWYDIPCATLYILCTSRKSEDEPKNVGQVTQLSVNSDGRLVEQHSDRRKNCATYVLSNVL